jgi:uncharacterized RDD family membrane protein YckC
VWVYSVALHARYGQTLGKMASGVKVLDLSEQRLPSLGQAFMRDIGPVVLNSLALGWLIYLVSVGRYTSKDAADAGPSSILALAGAGWALLELGTMLASAKLRALHDYIAGTVVVREDVPSEGRSGRAIEE